MKVLHPDFDAFGVSAMNQHIDSAILKGGPFGGTGFVFNRELSNALYARVDIKHPRVSVMELRTVSYNLLLINAYMPFFDTSNATDQLEDYRDTLGIIESIMSSHSTYKFLILMDMNCNRYNATHPYAILINSMMNDFDLISSFDHVPDFEHILFFISSTIWR